MKYIERNAEDIYRKSKVEKEGNSGC